MVAYQFGIFKYFYCSPAWGMPCCLLAVYEWSIYLRFPIMKRNYTTRKSFGFYKF